MTHRLLSTAVAGALLATLAACTPAGSGTEASPDPTSSPDATSSAPAVAEPLEGTPDPCELITVEALNEIAPVKMGEGQLNASLSGEGRSICVWRPASEDGVHPRVQVEINWAYPDPVRHRELATELWGSEMPDVKGKIEGATDAYFIKRRNTIGMGVGEYFVQVSYTPSGSQTKNKLTLAVAREVAKSLTGADG